MNFRRITSAVILGKRYTFGFGFPGSQKRIVDDGACQYHNRRVIIRSKDRGRSESLLECVIHEALHARFPDLSEEAVDDFAKLATKVFTRMSAHEK
jgi:hypothetical protein